MHKLPLMIIVVVFILSVFVLSKLEKIEPVEMCTQYKVSVAPNGQWINREVPCEFLQNEGGAR